MKQEREYFYNIAYNTNKFSVLEAEPSLRAGGWEFTAFLLKENRSSLILCLPILGVGACTVRGIKFHNRNCLHLYLVIHCQYKIYVSFLLIITSGMLHEQSLVNRWLYL